MTAVVGILNKHAVAVAADSAVTIGSSDNHKIFNKANKVFELSKFHPVGIMLYNSASFMSTPWETIIKVYRKQLYNRNFPKLEDYLHDFIEFLRLKGFFTDLEMQNLYLENLSLNVINTIIAEVNRNNDMLLKDPNPENKAEFLRLFQNQLIDFLSLPKDNVKYCPEFEDYSFSQFDNFSTIVIENLINFHFTRNNFEVTQEMKLNIKKVIYEILKRRETITNYTGLIFTGFGEDEIYPQLIPINVSMAIDGRLRFYIDDNSKVSISNQINGAVRPFAQTDVIETILQGIDPNLDEIYIQNFRKTFDKYNQAIVEIIGKTYPELGKAISNLDVGIVVNELEKMNLQIKRENYINPLMNAVSSLSKEDLAEMAESLIYLTYLKRRITFAEESVGGPVDVAVISKGDGFVWIKRKHYFRPELNHHFFENYLKK